jgi:hypothetical protein
MVKELQVVQLCLPFLTPKDVCLLRCTCRELRDMRVSWHDHSINFKLGESLSAITWLQKNIIFMRQLKLKLGSNFPQASLQHLMEVGRSAAAAAAAAALSAS